MGDRIVKRTREAVHQIRNSTNLCYRVGTNGIFPSMDSFIRFCIANQKTHALEKDFRHEYDACDKCGIGKRVIAGKKVDPDNVNVRNMRL